MRLSWLKTEGRGGVRRSVLNFALLTALCLSMGSRWLVDDAYPAAASTLQSQALGAAVVAVLCGAWAGVRRWRGVVAARSVARSAIGRVLGTVLVVAGASSASVMAGRHLTAGYATLALALTPVVVIVVCGAIDDGAKGDPMRMLWPGLCGMAGLLTLLPIPAFKDLRPWLALGAMPILMGLGGSLLKGKGTSEDVRSSQGTMWIWSLGCLLAGATLLGLGVGRPGYGRSGLPFGAGLLDGWNVALTLLTLDRLGAAGWSTQFFLVPLVAIVESALLMRPMLDVRTWIGLGLLLFGATRILLPGEDSSSRVSVLRQ